MIQYLKTLISSDNPASVKNAAFLCGVAALTLLLFMFGIGLMFGIAVDAAFAGTLAALVGLCSWHKDSTATTTSTTNTETPK